MERRLKIALIGTRGIPASHGGFETCVEEIGWRLVQKGHKVTVYSKKNPKYGDLKEYKGMDIVYIPRVSIKGFETLFAAFLAVLHTMFFKKHDFHMVFDPANSPTLLFYKLLGMKNAINVDGLGWQRDKWGKYAKSYYKWSEWAAVKLCKNIVTDSDAMADYYKKEYSSLSTTITYGANIPQVDQNEVEPVLAKYGLKKHGYILQITRFEPENNPLLTIQAFNKFESDLMLVLIGGVPAPTSYSEQIKNEGAKNPAVKLPGFIYDRKVLDIIWTNAFCYIHGNHIGGTNPALLQAMAAARPIIARDCIFNREVLAGYGYFYERNVESLLEQFNSIKRNHDDAESKAKSAFDRVKTVYTWEQITDQYEAMFKKLTKSS